MRTFVLCMCAAFGVTVVHAQTNTIRNFSFEQGSGVVADNWSPGWGGYERAYMPSGGWDGSYALRLAGPSSQLLGTVQRVDFNQRRAIPIRIDAQVKGENIADLAGDKIGAQFDCRVKFVGTDQYSYCPTTPKTKNVGTFHWRYIAFNTSHLINGHLPVEWIEVRLRRGAVSGTAWFDDVHVAEYDPGSFRGAVTLMFDDGFKEHSTFALPLISSYGWKGVEAAVTNYLSSGDPAYMTWGDLAAMRDAGWEIVSHSVSHRNMATLSPTEMEDEYYWSLRRMRERGFYPTAFALPFGGYNAFVLGLNEERGYYQSIRNSDRGWNPMGSVKNSIEMQEVKASTTMAEVNGWLSEAVSRKNWLVLMFHKVRMSCSDDFCTTETMFRNVMTAVSGSTMPVVTYSQGLTLVKGLE